MTSNHQSDQPILVTLPVLKAANAPKLGKRSAGRNVHYRLWTDDQRHDVYWQIAANDGGGQHSLELVAMTKVLDTLTTQAGKEPFRTRILRGVFRGRSTNNAGFLVCALYAEGLIAASEKANHHVITNADWEAWRQNCLKQPGQPVELAMDLARAALPADTAEPASKGRRGSKRKAQAGKEDEHADAS